MLNDGIEIIGVGAHLECRVRSVEDQDGPFHQGSGGINLRDDGF